MTLTLQRREVRPSWPPWTLGRRFAKRSFDVVFALAALVLLAPLLALVALAVRLDSPGPVLYRQRRCGHHGCSFEVLKFRSMVADADLLLEELKPRNECDGLLFKIRADPRITRIGSVLRRFSIDELPQLVNVVKGEMSLVGPRPLPAAAEDFGPVGGPRHAVRPGITGCWQVSGRSDLPYQKVIEMDLGYIRRSSFWTDVVLLLRTVPAVLGGRGAY